MWLGGRGENGQRGKGGGENENMNMGVYVTFLHASVYT